MATKAPTASSSQSIADLKTDTITLEDLGHSLPIGIFRKDGSVVRDYELNEYTGDREIELSKLSNRKKRKTTEILPLFLQGIIKLVGTTPLKEYCKEEDLSLEAFTGNLFLADALAMLLRLRVDSYGNEIRLVGNCPACNTKNVDSELEPSDLSSVEIKLSKAKSPIFELNLETGATFGKGTEFEETIKTIQLRPLRLREFSKINSQKSDDGVQAGLDYRLAFITIVGTPQESRWGSEGSYNGVMAQSAIEDLFKILPAKDRAAVLRAVNKLSGIGPLMRSGMTCKNCGTDFDVDVPWQDLSGFLSGII